MRKTLILSLLILLAFNLAACGTKDSEIRDANENNPNNTSNENNIKILTALEYFDTTKFDKLKFNGILYDRNGNSYNVSDLLIGDDNVNIISNDAMFYSFSNDFVGENSDFSSSGSASSNNYIHKILDLLGQPSTYMESYTEGNNGYSGRFYLLYRYDNYIIVFLGSDFRNWKEYHYIYPYIHACYITSIENNGVTNGKMEQQGYTVYGEVIN